MAVSTFTGLFSVAATGSQAITGVGFQPKAVIIWHHGGGGSQYWALGMATGSSNEFAVSSFSQSGVGTCNAFTAGRTDATIQLRDSGTTFTLADLTSLDSDGFTLNVTTAASSQDFGFFAIGGADVTNAFVGTTLVPASGGTHAVTGVGFTADLYLFTMVGQQDWNSTGTNSHLGMGAMTASAQMASFSWSDHTATSGQTNSYQRDDSTILLATGATPTQFLRFSKNAIGSDGFTFNLDDLGTTNAEVGFLALKFTSASWVKLGKETQPTSATTKQTSSTGVTPSGALFWGSLLASSASPQNESHMCIGAWDGSNNRAYASCDRDANTNMTSNRRVTNTKCVLRTDFSGGLVSEASVSASAYDSFTLNWTTADATAREFAYVVFGDPTAPSTFVPKVIFA